jgi:hypothetical protein
MVRSPNIRQVLEALEFARLERMRTGSPDFLRARVGEDRVQRLCQRLLRGESAEAIHRDALATNGASRKKSC